MSPAAARFQLLQGGRGAAALDEVLGRIRSRWGEAAAQEARHRVQAGSLEECRAWQRRSAYFPDLESMLDLSRPLPVVPFGIRGLLDLLSTGEGRAMSLLLIELSAYRRDWRETVQRAPWLEDLPGAGGALKHLQAQRWLLVGCPQTEQALALWSSVRRGRGIKASRYPRAGLQVAAQSPV